MKHKKITKIKAAVLAALTVTSMIGGSVVSADEFTNDTNAQDVAIEQFENLIDSFSTENVVSVRSMQQNDYSVTEQTVFPDNYGGAYYNNGKLNICLTDTSNNTDVQEIKNVVNDNSVNYVEVDYSLNDLLDTNDSIIDLMQDEIYRIKSVGVKQQNNVVEVYVEDESNKETLLTYLTENGIDTNQIAIYIDDITVTPVATYARPGDRNYLWYSNGTRYYDNGTIGYNAKLTSTGKIGYVTADHCLWNAAQNGYYVGIYEYSLASPSSCTRSATTDAAFVPFNSSISSTGVINNTNLYGTGKYQITASYTSAANLENVTLTSFGKTSGVFTGTVVNAYFSYNITNSYSGGTYTVSDALKIQSNTNAPEGGDSGGCVARITNSTTSPKQMTLAGITSMKAVTSSGQYYSYVSKASAINSALGVTVVGGSN